MTKPSIPETRTQHSVTRTISIVTIAVSMLLWLVSVGWTISGWGLRPSEGIPEEVMSVSPCESV